MREKINMGKSRVILKSALFLLAVALLSGCGTDAGISDGMKELEISEEVLSEQETGTELTETEQKVALYDRSPLSYDL